MQFDPLNDALVKIYNAEQAGKFDVELTPASKLLGNVLNIMQSSGYIGEYSRVENGRGDALSSNSEPSTDAVPSSHDTAFADKNSKSGRHVISLLRTLVFSF